MAALEPIGDDSEPRASFEVAGWPSRLDLPGPAPSQTLVATPPIVRRSMRRRWVAALCALGGWGVFEGVAATTSLREPGATESAPPLVTGVQLRVAPVGGDHRFRREALGLVTGLLEAHLYDTPGVVPRVLGAPLRPAARTMPAPDVEWGVDVELTREGDALELVLTTCHPGGGCEVHLERSTWSDAEALAGRAAREVLSRLGRAAPRLDPSPVSSLDYARLLLGRACAVGLGLVPPTDAPQSPEDPSRRALTVDQTLGLAAVMLARRLEDPEAARAVLDEASLATSGMLADRAAARFAAGAPSAAHHTWKSVGPGDARFALARAAAAAASGRPEQAKAIIAEAPPQLRARPEVAIVAAAMAGAHGQPTDGLLALWQDSLPSDPTPVRRRLEQRIEQHQFHDALPLADELARRGAPEDARRLTLAIATQLGELDLALSTAEALGDREVARRLALADRPEPDLLRKATSLEARLRRAEHWLAGFQSRRALAAARELSDEVPWWPEALDLERRACLALGLDGEARLLRSRVLHADPLFYASKSRP